MNRLSQILLTLTLSLFSINALASLEPGTKAPDFSLMGHDGKEYKLSDALKEGEAVVLEWFNNECPYVEKHYGSNNMQNLQKKYAAKKVKWFSIISSAEGKQGYRTAESATATAKERGLAATAVLLDPEGTVGRKFDAKVTPHMFVINKEGVVVYNGAIDDNSSSRASTIEGAENYVVAALDATLAGKEVATAKTKPYGCSVKYK